jgi:hypothetical protein
MTEDREVRIAVQSILIVARVVFIMLRHQPSFCPAALHFGLLGMLTVTSTCCQ